MALPPSCTNNSSGTTPTNYFETIVRRCTVYLKEDSVSLSFKGYIDTLEQYARLQEEDPSGAWILAKELNAWTEYFSSISNLIQKLYLDSETDKKEVMASISLTADKLKVANGERLANKDPSVVAARKKRNAMKCLFDELEAKIKFLERAYYHCKSTCDWANKSNIGIQTPGQR